MSIIINGTTLGSSASINGTSLNTINFNGTTVWTGIPPYYNELKSGTQLTESQWLAFLNGGGIKYIINKGEQSTFRNKTITISNSQTTSYSTWIIADFNHDGTSNTCDVIQQNIVHTMRFGYLTTDYQYSDIRTWLTGTYYNGFSTNIKNKLQTMSVKYKGPRSIGTVNDNVKLLSSSEVFQTGQTGNLYPIFQNDSTRKRKGVNYSFWWLRNQYNGDYVSGVDSRGGSSNAPYDNNNGGIVPCIRFV